ncbi:BQ2448_3156 [Microbotryum intermedium]|uniref:BQ2448_3156 protein n=1 Tax=Microbotryum intermedium TaxID=269621 RepID=A0A238FK74_9BASI|nr:BQ2448_3156 [Microbotryum intermedium]
MSSKTAADRTQRQLLELLHEPGNQECADCSASNPRWASWNHGVFLCVQCAGLHRKMGTHISRVKSLTLDVWSREQVAHMRARGNTRSNALLNPDTKRNPPPSSLDSNERESALERYIRAKYEYKQYMQLSPKSTTPAPQPVVASTSTPARPRTTSDTTSLNRPTTNGLAPPPSSGPTSSTLSVPDSISRPTSSTAPSPVARRSTPTVPSKPAAGRTTPSPEHASKRVRFRSEPPSIPYFDDDTPPTRTPSSARDRKTPAKGILRPRSGLSNGNEYRGASSTSALSGYNANRTTNGFGSSFFGYMPPDDDDDDEEEPPMTAAFPVAQRLVPMHTGSAIAYNSQRGPSYGQSHGAFQMPPPPNTHPFGQMWNSNQQHAQAQPQQQQPYQQQQQQAFNPFNGSSTYSSPFQHGPQPNQQTASYPQTQVAPSQGSIWDDLGMLGSIGSNPGSNMNMNGYHPQPSTSNVQQAPPSSNPFSFAPSLTLQTPNHSAPFPSSQPPTPATLTPLRPQLTGFVPSSDFGKQLLAGGSGSQPHSQASSSSSQPNHHPSFLSTPTSSCGPSSPAGSAPTLAPLRPQLTAFVPSSKFGLELVQENNHSKLGSGTNSNGAFHPSTGTGTGTGNSLQPPQPQSTGYGNGGGLSSPAPPAYSPSVQGLPASSSPFQPSSLSVNGTLNSNASLSPTYSTTHEGAFTMTSLQTALPTSTYQQQQQQQQQQQLYLQPTRVYNPFFGPPPPPPQQQVGMGGLTPQRTGTNPFLVMNGQYHPQQQQQQQQQAISTMNGMNGGQWRG